MTAQEMIEDDFDVSFIAKLALQEKQIQQNYRPLIAIHKWFARRPGTLFRGLLLAEFGDDSVAKSFSRSNEFGKKHVVDPFMGGGTPLMEANRLGCDVTGFDINPMAYWVVRQEIEHLDLAAYQREAERLIAHLNHEVGQSYITQCGCCGNDAPVKYFLWVKQVTCDSCHGDVDLFPGYLLAKDTRHPAHVIVCRHCGELNESDQLNRLPNCRSCKLPLDLARAAAKSRAVCPRCQNVCRYPSGDAPPRHRLFAIEYHCHACRNTHAGRFFKKPDHADLQRLAEVERRLDQLTCGFIPDDAIPQGDETKRLLRWGYRHYREMFNARQLLGLELSAQFVSGVADRRVRDALATNLSDLLRYQNMLCRYDTMALKSLDIFSVHGFPVSLIQCESNLPGLPTKNGGNIGSGGWSNIVTKFAKAKEYCDRPFETFGRGSRKQVVYTEREWIGESREGAPDRCVRIECRDSCLANLAKDSVDAVFTDPPYFGNVQYAELMDFCFVWLRKLVGEDVTAFQVHSTRNPSELTGNATEERGLPHFATGLSQVFQAMAYALKPGGPLAFTYHHNAISAYYAVGVAILDAGLPCTIALPCPAEMSGSIHISGTGSSIVDTVFVCRKDSLIASVPDNDWESWLQEALVRDVQALAEAGYLATDGDVNCLLNGHLVRLAICDLLPNWNVTLPIEERLERFRQAIARGEPIDALKHRLRIAVPRGQGQKQKTLFDFSVTSQP